MNYLIIHQPYVKKKQQTLINIIVSVVITGFMITCSMYPVWRFLNLTEPATTLHVHNSKLPTMDLKRNDSMSLSEQL